MRLKLTCKTPPPTPGPNGCLYRSGEEIDVVNAETGEALEGVRSVSFQASWNGLTTMIVEVLGAEADVEAEGVIVTREAKPSAP